MKTNQYFDKALRAKDQRYRRILQKLGYGNVETPADETEAPEGPAADLSDVSSRGKYKTRRLKAGD